MWQRQCYSKIRTGTTKSKGGIGIIEAEGGNRHHALCRVLKAGTLSYWPQGTVTSFPVIFDLFCPVNVAKILNCDRNN